MITELREPPDTDGTSAGASPGMGTFNEQVWALRGERHQLARTWIAAQELRLIFSALDRPRADEAFYRWLVYCADAAVPELTRLARTLDSWRPELLAYFDTGGISNGPTEAINLLIKKIKRVGHGFRNFDNYRLRLLLHCGVDWKTVRATPIRPDSASRSATWLVRWR